MRLAQRRAVDCLIVLVFSIALRLPLLMHPWTHSDSPAFLKASQYIAGELSTAEAPFRLAYPLYPLLSIAIGPLLASFVPSVLTPLFVFLAASLAFGATRPSFLAGLICAASPQLVRYSGVSLYDSLFLLMTAIVTVVLVRLAKNPSYTNACIAGACGGLAWATRGQGALYFPAIPVVLWMVARARFWQLAGLALLGFLAFGATPKASMVLLAKHRGAKIENRACMEQLVEDGILYSKGIEYRNSVTYAPDYPNPCELDWGQFIRKQERAYPRAVFANASHMLYGEVAGALSPFVVLAFPLSVGTLWMCRRNRVLLTALSVMAGGLLAAAMFVQLQDRYLFPLVIEVSIVAGSGLSLLWSRAKKASALLLGLILLAGCHTAFLAFATQ